MMGGEEILGSSPVSSRREGVERSGSGAYIAWLSEGQKRGFEYMKMTTDSAQREDHSRKSTKVE